jgi:uncharacterized repeat protein (TIGR03803 family)
MLVVTILAMALLAIATPASAQTLDVLHHFAGGTDGNYPQGGVIRDAEGNLYGTTAFGGVSCELAGCGTVYKIDKNGEYTVLYRFQWGNDGAAPRAGLVRDAAGNLYGTTQGQGSPATVFKVDKNGNETVLFVFENSKKDGCCADAPLVLDAAGNLYGTSPFGIDENGVVYKIDAHGRFSVVHTFTDIADGALPYGGLVIDASGNLYGATVNGGDDLKKRSCYTDYNSVFENGCGTVFKITPNGEFSVLYRFHGSADGGNPVSVVLDPAGNLYGVTDSGGDLKCSTVFLSGCGTIFKIDTAGKFSVLHTFRPNPVTNPNYNNLFLDSKGNIYGSNQEYPYSEAGTLFELDTTGKYTVLYTFSDESDGLGISGAMIAPNGDFYGTLATGGGFNCGSFGGPCGTVFKLTP